MRIRRIRAPVSPVLLTVSLALVGVGTGIDTVKTWGFRGGYSHNWNPNWVSGIYGAYAQLKYGDTGKALICGNFAAIALPGATCNPDFNFAVIGVNTAWTPVKNLTFTADLKLFASGPEVFGHDREPGHCCCGQAGSCL
ncbi:hypothetical protein ACVWXO_009641 [Bradyrhizobium sp. LM2.7]